MSKPTPGDPATDTAAIIDDREKFDHSAHPTGHRLRTDLCAPGGGAVEHPEGRRRVAVQEREDSAGTQAPEAGDEGSATSRGDRSGADRP